jgi:hypothetical protein
MIADIGDTRAAHSATTAASRSAHDRTEPVSATGRFEWVWEQVKGLSSACVMNA